MFDHRMKGIGKNIEKTADQSMEEWRETEKELNKNCHGTEDITVSVDAGWQTRGSGIAYNSLSVKFSEKSKNNVIFRHNIFNYDCPILYNAVDNCKLLDNFQLNVTGFVDTLKLFKNVYPGCQFYSQSLLCKDSIDLSYCVHNADEDVSSLRTLVNEKANYIDKIRSAYEHKDCIVFQYCALKSLHKNLTSLKLLVDSKIILQIRKLLRAFIIVIRGPPKKCEFIFLRSSEVAKNVMTTN